MDRKRRGSVRAFFLAHYIGELFHGSRFERGTRRRCWSYDTGFRAAACMDGRDFHRTTEDYELQKDVLRLLLTFGAFRCHQSGGTFEAVRVPHPVERIDELVHHLIGMEWRGRQPEPFGAAWDSGIVDRLDIDVVFPEQRIRNAFA